VSEVVTHGEAETEAAGRVLGERLQPGAVVLLSGPLGAGKTAFARGLAAGLGCDTEDVSSPTFTIVQEYQGRLDLQHADLYRISPAEVDDLALEEIGADGVLAVEWPDRWARRPTDAIQVDIDVTGTDTRRIRITDPSLP
jgi:tRNA threonylcarbamoyladenosine biosynthesis protein TsaE